MLIAAPLKRGFEQGALFSGTRWIRHTGRDAAHLVDMQPVPGEWHLWVTRCGEVWAPQVVEELHWPTTRCEHCERLRLLDEESKRSG